jgi:hypothetical protein
MISPPEAGLGRRRGWGLPHGTKTEERQSPGLEGIALAAAQPLRQSGERPLR